MKMVNIQVLNFLFQIQAIFYLNFEEDIIICQVMNFGALNLNISYSANQQRSGNEFYIQVSCRKLYVNVITR